MENSLGDFSTVGGWSHLTVFTTPLCHSSKSIWFFVAGRPYNIQIPLFEEVFETLNISRGSAFRGSKELVRRFLFGGFWMSRKLCFKQEDNKCRSVFLLQLRFLFWNWVPFCSAWIFIVCWWANWAHAWMVDPPQAKVIKWLGVEPFQDFEIAPAWFICPFKEPFYLLTPPSSVQPKKHPRTETCLGLRFWWAMEYEIRKRKQKSRHSIYGILTYMWLIFNGKCWNIYSTIYII